MIPVEVLGWLGQACFFSRFLVQWLLSERAKRSLAPPVFWWLSLVGAVLYGSYLTIEGLEILLAGTMVNGSIAVRNLILSGGEGRRRVPVPLVVLLGLATWGILLALGVTKIEALDSPAWYAVGIAGTAIWTSRFVVQWIATERRGESHFPRAFWWISLVGNALLLAYAIHLRDPIVIAGFVPGPLVQIRNLVLSSRHARAEATA